MEQRLPPHDTNLWEHDTPWTWANLVTLLRTVIGVPIFAAAFVREDLTLALIGLAIYWGMDMLDGFLARVLNQETRLGAQLDILCDRILIAFFYFIYLSLKPDLALPIGLFLIQFMVIDQYISNQYLRYSLLSPNYFHKVDKIIWQLNWSPPGKFLNGGLVTFTLLFTNTVNPAAIFAIILLGVKIYSAIRLHQLPVPSGRQTHPYSANSTNRGRDPKRARDQVERGV